MEEKLRTIRFTYRRRTDRISSLPKAIIHEHIFSRLSGKDIKVMSCLSKTWYLLSNSFPFLVFSKPKYEHHDTLNNYLNCIHQAINRFYELHTNKDDQILRMLSIPLNYHPTAAPLLDSLINLVLRRGVEEFDLCIVNNHYNSNNNSSIFYNLPKCVFSQANSIIKVASFRGCSLMQSFLSPLPNVNLIIKKLYLSHVLMNETVLSSIISSCPLIEVLNIDRCMGVIKFLRISHLHKLKVLSILCPENMNIPVEIDSLSLLQSLLISGGFKVHIIGDYPVLTRLRLIGVGELESQEIISRLPMLRSLELVRIHSLKNLKVSSVTLNRLEVVDCENLVGLNIDDAPNLLSVLYSNYSVPRDLVASSSSVRWDVTIRYIFCSWVQFKSLVDFFVDFSNFVSKVRNMEFLNLYFQKYPLYLSRDLLFEELKQRLAQPIVPKIDYLNLFIVKDIIRKSHLFLLDGVLWKCHPRTLSLQLGMNDNNYAANMICKNIMGHLGGCCLCTLARRSWLHHLDDVIGVTSDGTESKLIMDGTFKPSSLYFVTQNTPLYTKIKFIFNW